MANIGVFLDIENDHLKCIQRENNGNCRDCLREMLDEWLKQPHPTWSQLTEAVKVLNSNVAEKIQALQR